MLWKVCKGNHWIGILESNYAWALPYWTARGYKLILLDNGCVS